MEKVPLVTRDTSGDGKGSKGFLYVVDMGNNRILKIDKNGEVVDAIGTLGEGPGKFNMPFGIAVDKEVIF